MVSRKDRIKILFLPVILVASLAFIVVSGMKLLFEAPRPCEFLDSCPDSYSFPSRHTGVAFAVATMLSLNVKKVWYRILFFVIATTVGYWRIAIGFHTVYDIIGGAIVGIIVGVFVYYFVKKFRGAIRQRK